MERYINTIFQEMIDDLNYLKIATYFKSERLVRIDKEEPKKIKNNSKI